MVQVAFMAALIVVLQLVSTMTAGLLPVNITLTLMPIVIGGMLLGPLYGAALGIIFGIIVLVLCAAGMDVGGAILFQANPFLCSLLCLVKGGAAGLVSGVLYNLFKNKDGLAASFIAAAAAPVVNTGLFIVGALFMSDTLSANFVDGTTVIYFLVIVCAGVNFLVELAINLIFAPAIFKLTQIIEKYIKR